MTDFRTQHSEYRGETFPFEAFVRQRYHAFRRRRSFDLASVFQLAALVVVLSLVVFALMIVVSVLVAVLMVSPFIILAQVLARVLSGDQDRPQFPEDDFARGPFGDDRPHRPSDQPTIIDIEVDRRS